MTEFIWPSFILYSNPTLQPGRVNCPYREITGQKAEHGIDAGSKKLYSLSVGFFQEEELRKRLRSWRVNVGGEQNDTAAQRRAHCRLRRRDSFSNASRVSELNSIDGATRMSGHLIV